MRYTQTLAAMVLGAVLAAPAAYAQILKKSDQKIDNADASAMKQLAQANLNEIEGGKAAAAKAQSPDVKQFAQKMATDHQQMLTELDTLAKSKGVALPQSGSLKDKAEMKMMERSSGADFDKKYMEQMVKDHQKDAKETQDIAANGLLTPGGRVRDVYEKLLAGLAAFDRYAQRVGLQRLELIRIHPAGLGRRAWLWFRQVLPPRLPGKKNARCADRSANPAWPTSCRSTQALAGWPLSVCYPSGRSCAIPHVCARYQRVRGIATDSLAGLERACGPAVPVPS